MNDCGDPCLRRFGMSVTALWGTLIGATAWLPTVLTVWVLEGGADLWGFILLATPYVGVIEWLLESRLTAFGGTSSSRFCLGLGAYALYLWALVETWAVKSRSIVGTGSPQDHAHWLIALGALGVIVGAVGVRRGLEDERHPAGGQPS